ncbi:Sap-like sulfolipid-1-addressing protein [Microterricola gilva]|uniref:Sap-like sulfolipid-1-addressing protein n=1 Tax=Microterricola gilva TaxID=393267 RepID=A0A4Q8ANP9_9MICO|nr:GAP family protein [Microterricola gilva]RZU65615.1 Sap-like sulfolipid-1-addressing protein [Microterricola gilva]
MLQAIGHILPIALAVAISSVPILATVVILLSPERSRTAIPFLIAWVIGIIVVVSVCTIGAHLVPTPTGPRKQDDAVGVAEIVAGLALGVTAVVSWRRSRKHPEAAMPKWLNKVESLHPRAVFGLGMLMNVRPKAILLAIAAGLAVAAEDLSVGQSALTIGVYTAIAASTVVVPIVLTLADPARMEPRLRATQTWLIANGSAVTSLILLVVAFAVVGSGLARF